MSLSPGLFARGNSSTNEYPYATDSQEWKALSRSERVDACKIPEGILQDMSTKYIDAVLAYPMRADLQSALRVEIELPKLVKMV